MAATDGVKQKASLTPRQMADLANEMNEAGRKEEALKIITPVIQHCPDEYHAWNVLGTIQCPGNHVRSTPAEYAAAYASFDKALGLAVAAGDVEAINLFRSNRAMVMTQIGRREEAILEWEECLRREPDNPIFWNNLGNTYEMVGRYNDAIQALDRTLALDPDHLLTYFNRGIALCRLDRQEEAIANFNRAISMDPRYADAYYNRGIARLALGDLPRGFEDYEWRFQSPTACKGSIPKLDQPQWNGRASLKGKSILLHGEQGLGDMIQMMRYVPAIVDMGAEVKMVLHRPLKPLMDIAGVELLDEGKVGYPTTDYWLPMMSLPMVFKTSITTVPSPWRPKPHQEKFAEWRGRLRNMGLVDNGRPKIGLVWSGNPNHKQDARRSLSFSELEPLLKVKSADFVIFQKDARPADAQAAEMRRKVHPRLWSVSEYLTDFRETAHALAFMDLVITVDTAVAHLAATLGKETWIMTAKHVTDWRWMKERTDSIWYPRVVLYRQEASWSELINRMAGDLKGVAARYH